MFAETMGIAEANVWNSNPPPRGSEYGVAAIGILMSPALDSTIPVFSIPEATGAWGDEEHSFMALEGKLPGSNTSGCQTQNGVSMYYYPRYI